MNIKIFKTYFTVLALMAMQVTLASAFESLVADCTVSPIAGFNEVGKDQTVTPTSNINFTTADGTSLIIYGCQNYPSAKDTGDSLMVRPNGYRWGWVVVEMPGDISFVGTGEKIAYTWTMDNFELVRPESQPSHLAFFLSNTPSGTNTAANPYQAANVTMGIDLQWAGNDEWDLLWVMKAGTTTSSANIAADQWRRTNVLGTYSTADLLDKEIGFTVEDLGDGTAKVNITLDGAVLFGSESLMSESGTIDMGNLNSAQTGSFDLDSLTLNVFQMLSGTPNGSCEVFLKEIAAQVAAPIPEPAASAALIGLLTLGLVMRRK